MGKTIETTTANTILKADRRKTTSLLKKYLKAKYGIETSIKSEIYSGGSSLNVSYTGGVSEKTIKAELNRLQYGNFNGMEDIYEYKNDAETGIVIDGYQLEDFKYIFVNQEISKDFVTKCAFLLSEFYSLKEEDKFNGNINERISVQFMGAWDWSNLVYRSMANNTNFVTQDLSQIEPIKVELVGNCNDKVFTYLFNGKEYRTDKWEDVREVKLEVPKKEKEIVLNGVKLVDYSEKAIAVIGNSYEIKDELKEIGGRFNKFLKVDGKTCAGWIFPKYKEDEVTNLLIEYSRA